MERFVHRQNIEHYRKLLAETSDKAQRRQIMKLLAEEEAKEVGGTSDDGRKSPPDNS